MVKAVETPPLGREYLEMTLHLKGGAQVVAAVTEFSATRSRYAGEGYASLNWINTNRPELPKLSTVVLPEIVAITSREMVLDS